jgi:hypothetical protein
MKRRRPGTTGTGGWRRRIGRYSSILAAALVLFRLLVAVHAPSDAGPAPGAGEQAHDVSGAAHAHAHGNDVAAGDPGDAPGGGAAAEAHGCHFCRETDLLVPEPGSVPVRMRTLERGPVRLAAAELPVLERPFLTSLHARAPPPSA